MSAVLQATAHQPHARAVLASAFPSEGPPAPSHAYLFHGPAGSGKREVARALAADLLTRGTGDPSAVAARIARDAHPDLTWVRPTGAGEMRVADIDEAVVGAVSRRPFEAAHRVFVLEHADALNDTAANRLLKTLEEPPSYVVLVLLSDRPGELLPTVRSRCQAVRFDAPPEDELVRRIVDRALVPEETARSCARLALGDAGLAERLAGDEGRALRAAAESLARHALGGTSGMPPWRSLIEVAVAHGEAAAAAVVAAAAERAEQLPDRERKRIEREATDDGKRASRRARTQTLDLALRLCGLWLRDVAAAALGATGQLHHLDRAAAVGEDAQRLGDPHRALRGVELVDATRRSLRVNATEELQLDALSIRLAEAVGPRRR